MHITIIDDERILTEKIRKRLEHEWFSVSIFYSYDDFIKNGNPNSQFYIVDISLGWKTGYEIVRWLRESSHCLAPIMMISAYNDSQRIVHGLDLGADDYMIKPFSSDEFVARVRALFRRPTMFVPLRTLTYKWICLDPVTHKVKTWDNTVRLTHKENMILEFFLKNQWVMVSRENLITNIWWWNLLSDVTDNTINVTMSKLRKKIWEDFNLRTMYNGGYILE